MTRFTGILLLVLFCLPALVWAQSIDDRYHRFDEIETALQNYAATYPDLAMLKTLGYTAVDNFPLYAIKISDNVTEEEDEPAIFFLGTLHAEEILGVEVAMFMVDSLLTGYANGDPQVQKWVNDCEIWIMPDANPEGHEVVMDGLDIYYRKNKRDNNDNSTFLEDIDYNPDLNYDSDVGEGWDDYDGVDLNRNWDFHWEQSPDANPTWNANSGNYYRGPAPFSEPEAVAMRDLLRDEHVVLALFMHSSRRGDPDSPYIGGLLKKWDKRERFFYPWTYELGWTDISPDFWTIRDIAANMANQIDREDRDADASDCGCNMPESYRCDLQRASKRGLARDYAYAKLGTYAFNAEIGRWIQPDGDFVDPFVRKLMGGVSYLLDRPFFSGISGLVTDAASGQPLEAEIEILELDNSSLTEPRLTNPATGRYYRFLLPNGTQNMMYHPCHLDWSSSQAAQFGDAPANYTMRVSRPGYNTVTINNIQVNSDTLTVVDVVLEYEGYMANFPVMTEPINYSSPTLRDLDQDEVPEMVVASVEGGVHVFTASGQEFPGWPQFTNGHDTLDETSTPAIGDVDHDGEFEIVYGSVDGNLYVWNPDGTAQDGFPVALNVPVMRATVTLYDINADGSLEIFVSGGADQLFAYHADGTPVDGWPKTTGRVRSVAIGDVDNDGEPEMIAAQDSDMAQIYGFEADGSLMPNFPLQTFQNAMSSPVLADVDNDGDLEIFIGSNGPAALQHDGTAIDGFADPSGPGDLTAAAISDLDRDGDLEILFGFEANNDGQGGIVAYHHDGTTVLNFPVFVEGSVTSQPILVNLQDDPKQEIIFTTDTGDVHIIDYTGEAIDGYPFRVSPDGLTSTPAVGDLDGDSRTEFLVGSLSGGLYAFDTDQFYFPVFTDWPMFQHDHYHSGQKEFFDVVAVDDTPTPNGLAFQMFAPYPNPTRTGARVAFVLPARQNLSLQVYNVAGQLVRTLNDGPLTAGAHEMMWDGRTQDGEAVSSGVYFFRLETVDHRVNQKVVLLR